MVRLDHSIHQNNIKGLPEGHLATGAKGDALSKGWRWPLLVVCLW